MQEEPRVTIFAQGHIFGVGRQGDPQRGGGRRGAVVGFSPASRKRLLERFARLDHRRAIPPLFLTLTYPAEFPDCNTARRHRRAFEKRLRRRYGDCVALVWRLELQKRGAPHFHILVWGVPFLPIADIRAMWAAVIGYEGPERLQIQIERMRSWRGVMAYASKYIAKVTRSAPGAGGAPVGARGGTGEEPAAGAGGQLDSISYLAAGGDTSGRVWGIVNGDRLPWGRLEFFQATGGEWFHRVKRAGRRVWPGVNDNSWAGFTLFCDNPYQWFEMAGSMWSEGA